MSDEAANHDDRIRDQFTRQAIPFTSVPGHLDAIGLLIEMIQPEPADTVLDVACGPGLVATAIAAHVAHVEGLDITAAMLDAAQARQRQVGLTNMSWRLGTVEPLPYADASFDLVVTRYSFHHLLRPHEALREMIRVCRSGGRVLVADVVQPAMKAAAYDRLEKIRDPSHSRVLVAGEMDQWFAEAGLVDAKQGAYGVDIEMEAQLRASFPAPGGADRLRRMFAADIGIDAFGIDARRVGDELHYTVPVGVFVGRKR